MGCLVVVVLFIVGGILLGPVGALIALGVSLAVSFLMSIK